MEQAGVQAYLPLSDAVCQALFPHYSLTSILSALFLTAVRVLSALFLILAAAIILTALVRCLLLLHLEKVQALECSDL